MRLALPLVFLASCVGLTHDEIARKKYKDAEYYYGKGDYASAAPLM